jgi:formate C-acetyltransferase
MILRDLNVAAAPGIAAADDASAPLDPWRGFRGERWRESIDLRDFIVANFAPWEGDESFLAPATERTAGLWRTIEPLLAEERRCGVLGVSQLPSDIEAHAPGYIDRDLELIVGLQTERPLVRAIMPKGGWRIVADSLAAIGVEPDPAVESIFTRHRKTHNDGVFDAYTETMLKARAAGIITGLPDGYGRGRIIGDYRRLALYGLDRLVAVKRAERAALDACWSDEPTIRLREELAEQVRALESLGRMAAAYGCDVHRPAATAHEAVQWTYFAYLAAIKQQNGAAMSVGRISTFLDIYLERDIAEGRIDESRAQELIDDLVIKLRLVRFLRTPDYDQLFSGDPVWATECIGGLTMDGRPMVTRSSFRMLHTLTNLGPAPEPNLTVLWSPDLPAGFKRYCARVSQRTSSIQYESDDLIRTRFGDDTAIACCVSAMRVGKQMQFFGARVNLAKSLLYAINGGRDELTGEQVGPEVAVYDAAVLEYEPVMARLDVLLDWLTANYVGALNVIHYMHDRYCYESLEMALHDAEVERTLACGVAGLSVVADALSAIRYATVRPIRDARGLVVDYAIEGEFPTFGNNDERVDDIAVELLRRFLDKLRGHPTYRNARHTVSVLTITANVVYGRKTGNTPDGRRSGEPFAPGANPMHGRDHTGALAAMLSVARIPYALAEDGISLTLSLLPHALGPEGEGEEKLADLLDAYFASGGFHININVLRRETLEDAMQHPEKYPQLTVRVSGYAVNFIKLTPEQQRDVIARTFHGTV